MDRLLGALFLDFEDWFVLNRPLCYALSSSTCCRIGEWHLELWYFRLFFLLLTGGVYLIAREVVEEDLRDIDKSGPPRRTAHCSFQFSAECVGARKIKIQLIREENYSFAASTQLTE